MAYTPYAGYQARIRYGVGNTVVNGIVGFNFDKQVAEIDTTHFESTADANGTVWKTFVKGLADASGTIDGIFDGDATSSEAVFAPGTTVTLDLLVDKTGPKGWIDFSCIITGFSPRDTLADKATFSVRMRITGVPAAFA